MKRDNGKAYIELHNKRASSAAVSRKNHGGGGGATNAFDVPPNEVVLAGAGSRRPPRGSPEDRVLMNRPVRIGAVVCSDGIERVAIRFVNLDPLD